MRPRDPLANPEPLIRRVYAFFAYRIGDGPEAEDMTSETFERALRYRHTYDPQRAIRPHDSSGSPAVCSELDGRDRELIALARLRATLQEGEPSSSRPAEISGTSDP